MTYYEKIAQRRKEMSFTQKQMAEYLGISQQGYALYEKGKRKIDFETALKIGEKLEISLDDLGLDYIGESKKNEIIPLNGAVACGEPIVSESNEIFNFDDIDADFALRCKGDSMTGAKINDGDIVLIKQCPEVENGEIAAVAVDLDGECTLKKVYYDREKARLTLMPCNPSYEPIIIEGPALEDVRILGRAVVCVSKV